MCSILRLLHMTKKSNMRRCSEDYDRDLEIYYDHMEEQEDQDCKCIWDGYQVTYTCLPCNILRFAPVCSCEWRDLRNRSYRTTCCTECKPVDPLENNVWRKQILGIRKRISAIDAAYSPFKRLKAIFKLFAYLCAQSAFVRSNAKFQSTMLEKAREFRADNQAARIFPILDQVVTLFEG